MDALEAILGRRSVRKFTDDPVSEETIESLLRAAMAAPSARNQQPWVVIVVREKSLLEKVAAAQPHGGMTAGAQVAVLICADTRLVKSEGFWIQDCAAATQNLLVAAHALGLGAVWVGTYPREARMEGMSKVFKLPEHIVPFALVPLGYPAERPAPADRFDGSRVHLDGYEGER